MFGLKWDAKRRVLAISTTIAAVATVSPVRPVVFLGNSMSPTYASWSVVWATPDVGTLKRGDVVVADTPQGRVVKRVGLIAGDGYWEKKRYDNWVSALQVGRNLHKGIERFVTVPQGMVYLVGDNSLLSIDSRTFGAVPVESVRLKVLDNRPSRGDLVLYGAVLRKNYVLRSPKPVVE